MCGPEMTFAIDWALNIIKIIFIIRNSVLTNSLHSRDMLEGKLPARFTVVLSLPSVWSVTDVGTY